MRGIFQLKRSIVISAGLIVALLVSFSIPGRRMGPAAYRVKSFNQMRQIAVAISLYTGDNNGKWPTSFRDLYPDYLADAETLFFQSPFSNSVSAPNMGKHPEMADIFSPYCFMRLADNRILIVERPGLWKDGKMTYCLLGKDREPVGNSASCHVIPDEFKRRFANGFPDVPFQGGYQRIESCHIDSNEYELNYTGQELDAIHKAFQASGRGPITAEAARAKVQTEMEHLNASGSWEVEEGILTSDGSTPFYHFRCAYIKDGKKKELLDAFVLLDGTVLTPKRTK